MTTSPIPIARCRALHPEQEADEPALRLGRRAVGPERERQQQRRHEQGDRQGDVDRQDDREQGHGPDCTGGHCRGSGGPHRLERDPVALRGPADDRQPGRLQGGPDVILAVDEDPRGEQAPVRPELSGEPGRERLEQRGDQVRQHEIERRLAARQAARRAANLVPRRLRRALAALASIAIGSVSSPTIAPAPNSPRRDPEDPRAAADVEDAAAARRRASAEAAASAQRLDPGQAQPGRRMEARPERHPRVDRDHDVVGVRGGGAARSAG